jgi:hypothetical protein
MFKSWSVSILQQHVLLSHCDGASTACAPHQIFLNMARNCTLLLSALSISHLRGQQWSRTALTYERVDCRGAFWLSRLGLRWRGRGRVPGHNPRLRFLDGQHLLFLSNGCPHLQPARSLALWCGFRALESCWGQAESRNGWQLRAWDILSCAALGEKGAALTGCAEGHNRGGHGGIAEAPSQMWGTPARNSKCSVSEQGKLLYPDLIGFFLCRRCRRSTATAVRFFLHVADSRRKNSGGGMLIARRGSYIDLREQFQLALRYLALMPE